MSAPAVAVLTAEQVAAIVRQQVDEALAEQVAERPPTPELVDAATMCRLIMVSRTTLHRLRVAGMPAIRVGDTYRYRPSAVVAWLESERDSARRRA